MAWLIFKLNMLYLEKLDDLKEDRGLKVIKHAC